MAEEDVLKVHVKINSRYQIFDQSGSLPFSIVFGIYRRSHQDTDTRSLILDTSASVFDVPYALANGLLRLFEGQERKEVDLSSFHAEASPHQYIAISPPSQRAVHLTKDPEMFLNRIDNKSDLALLLRPNTKYVIRLASTDLGVQWWSFSDLGEILPGMTLSSAGISEAARLVNSKESAGKAAFTTRDSLPSPPDLNVHLKVRFQSQSLTTRDENGPEKSPCVLEVSIANTDTENPVSVQSTGHQHFLCAWGPFQPVDIIDDRLRLTSTKSASLSSLGKQNFIIRSKSNNTSTIAHRTSSPVCQGLVSAKIDRRPTRSDFTTLWPGKPLLLTFDLADLLITALKLPDGEYEIGLETLGAWWCWGTVDEIFDEGDEGVVRMEEKEEGKEEKEKEKEKIPKAWYKVNRPPIWFKSEDQVVVRIVDGKVQCE